MDIFSRGKKAANEKEQQKEFFFHSPCIPGHLRCRVSGFNPESQPTCDAYLEAFQASYISLSVCITFVCSVLSLTLG
jgi:hypothetical protein